MKKIYSCLIILSFLTSCTIENDSYPAFNAPAVESDYQPDYAQRLSNELPINSKNSFDTVGTTYNEILQTYDEANSGANTLSQILLQVNNIAAANSRFQDLKSNSYQPTTADIVQPIVNSPNMMVAVIINRSGLGSMAKESFTVYLQNLKARCKSDEEFDAIYDFIVLYEDSIAKSTVFTSFEKQVLLTSTSISRFATYRKKRRPKKNTDQDWDWLIAGIVAGTEGVAAFSPGNAITMAAAVTIASE